MKVLVLNCGSSTVKYKLYDLEEDKVLAGGLAERIGMPGSKLWHRYGDHTEVVLELLLSGHREAIRAILNLLTHIDHGVIDTPVEIQAVGHRVVHGGEYFRRPVIVDEGVLKLLKEYSRLAPLHNPPNIQGIQVCREQVGHALHVAVFDTAFHQTMPDYAYMYAIPYEYFKKHMVRKYGFHGISHQYVARRAAELLCAEIEKLKIITCHLGNGASLCAVRDGISKDTTMGFNPLAGLMMGTRSGDVDPAIIPFLSEKEGITLTEAVEILNKRSGALGIYGSSGDFRDVELAARKGNERARLALDMFVYSVAKGIGSLIPALGGLDVLVFTAGIGENSPEIRRRICNFLEYASVSINEQKNSVQGTEIEISRTDSTVKVLVIPTDEEKMIACETRSLAETAKNGTRR